MSKLKRHEIRIANFRREQWKTERSKMLQIARNGSKAAQKRHQIIDENLREFFATLPQTFNKEELINALTEITNYQTKSGKQKNINNLIRRCVSKGFIEYNPCLNSYRNLTVNQIDSNISEE